MEKTKDPRGHVESAEALLLDIKSIVDHALIQARKVDKGNYKAGIPFRRDLKEIRDKAHALRQHVAIIRQQWKKGHMHCRTLTAPTMVDLLNRNKG